MTSTLTSKGQITIPKKVREHLQINKGSKVSFYIDHDGSVVMNSKKKANH